MVDLSKVNRVEVIDHRLRPACVGRVLVINDNSMQIEIVLQDDKQTLKIFINGK